MNVRSVVGSFKAFCALRSDGQVVAWGDAKSGGVVPPSVEGRSRRVNSNGFLWEFLGTNGTCWDFKSSWCFGTCRIFPSPMGISSSQLTNSMIFQRAQPQSQPWRTAGRSTNLETHGTGASILRSQELDVYGAISSLCIYIYDHIWGNPHKWGYP